MLRACQGLVPAISFIKGSELFQEACFMHAEHGDISWVISLVMPGQKIDCLAQSRGCSHPYVQYVALQDGYF